MNAVFPTEHTLSHCSEDGKLLAVQFAQRRAVGSLWLLSVTMVSVECTIASQLPTCSL
jgi:hypothetical protein